MCQLYIVHLILGGNFRKTLVNQIIHVSDVCIG